MPEPAHEPPRAHVEVLVSALLGRASTLMRLPASTLVGAGAAAVREMISGAVAAGEQLAAGVTRRAVDAPRQLREDPLLGPWLARVRSGTRLQQDVADFFADLLGRAGRGEEVLGSTQTDTGDLPAPGPASTTADTAPSGAAPTAAETATTTDDVSAQVAAIGDALADGIRRAAERGGVVPARSAEVTAWALTSLLMTLVMRSRGGEDPDQLVEVALQAIDELLAPQG